MLLLIVGKSDFDSGILVFGEYFSQGRYDFAASASATLLLLLLCCYCCYLAAVEEQY